MYAEVHRSTVLSPSGCTGWQHVCCFTGLHLSASGDLGKQYVRCSSLASNQASPQASTKSPIQTQTQKSSQKSNKTPTQSHPQSNTQPQKFTPTPSQTPMNYQLRQAQTLNQTSAQRHPSQKASIAKIFISIQRPGLRSSAASGTFVP